MGKQDWWRGAVVYQVYPQSFKDTTGTGKGDLNGITSKLPYLEDLGVDVVWLSPIYASPMIDMGYDISDYRAINPDFGTMQDWERLVKEAHQIGLKVVMDLVVNHTSDQHVWFQNAMAGGDKKDWYVWRGKSKDGKEPNNWGAIFGGSCWEWNERLQEYYLHVFDVSQPDLNWENSHVRAAVWDLMRFWLDKGCDGFRMDVINCISKTPGFPDAPVTDTQSSYQYGLIHRFNGPKVAEYLREMHEQVLNHYPHTFTVGEAPGLKDAEQALPLVKDGKPLQVCHPILLVCSIVADAEISRCFLDLNICTSTTSLARRASTTSRGSSRSSKTSLVVSWTTIKRTVVGTACIWRTTINRESSVDGQTMALTEMLLQRCWQSSTPLAEARCSYIKDKKLQWRTRHPGRSMNFAT